MKRARLARRQALAAAIALVMTASADGSVFAARRPRARRSDAPATAGAGKGVAAKTNTGPAVQFVTDKRAYLNRGAADGLEAKQTIQLFRGGRAVGACTIEILAERQASCTGGRPRPGDKFRLGPRRASRGPAPRVPELPPIADDATLAERVAAVRDAPYTKVDFSGARALGDHTRAQLAPGISVWRTQPDAGGDYVLEQIDGAVAVYDIAGTGARFDAAFSAMRWEPRGEAGRFRPLSPTQFYLWEAEVSRRRAGSKTVFAVGRIWPWNTPGLTLFDGIQVGRRNETETMEGGVYAGLVPWALSVAPSADAWTTGAYAALAQTGDGKRPFRLAREEARIGIASSPETGFLSEAEARGQLWLGTWHFSGGGHALRAPMLAPRPEIDRAYVDLGARATDRFGLGLHVRYFSGTVPPAALVAVAPAGGSLVAATDVHWDLTRRLGVAASGGLARDHDTGRGLAYAAAELRLPRLLGDIGGLSGGLQVDTGWLEGWLLYAQLAGRFGDRIRVVMRGSASANAYTSPQFARNVDEIGGSFHLDGALARWLRLRAWGLVRVPVLVDGQLPVPTAFGTAGGFALAGGY